MAIKLLFFIVGFFKLIPAWTPWTATDIKILEKVLRRAINLISGLKGANYEEKLVELGILSLEKRRIRYDLIQTWSA